MTIRFLCCDAKMKRRGKPQRKRKAKRQQKRQRNQKENENAFFVFVLSLCCPFRFRFPSDACNQKRRRIRNSLCCPHLRITDAVPVLGTSHLVPELEHHTRRAAYRRICATKHQKWHKQTVPDLGTPNRCPQLTIQCTYSTCSE